MTRLAYMFEMKNGSSFRRENSIQLPCRNVDFVKIKLADNNIDKYRLFYLEAPPRFLKLTLIFDDVPLLKRLDDPSKYYTFAYTKM